MRHTGVYTTNWIRDHPIQDGTTSRIWHEAHTSRLASPRLISPHIVSSHPIWVFSSLKHINIAFKVCRPHQYFERKHDDATIARHSRTVLRLSQILFCDPRPLRILIHCIGSYMVPTSRSRAQGKAKARVFGDNDFRCKCTCLLSPSPHPCHGSHWMTRDCKSNLFTQETICRSYHRTKSRVRGPTCLACRLIHEALMPPCIRHDLGHFDSMPATALLKRAMHSIDEILLKDSKVSRSHSIWQHTVGKRV